jgi:phage baseplate assembly protein W
MKGMHATTGRTVTGLAHLHQSIARIITTPLGTCIQRRTFGSDVPEHVDAPNNGTTRTRLYAAIATALMRWEPRLILTRVQLSGEPAEMRSGMQAVDIEGMTAETGEAFSVRVPISASGSGSRV